ncbi:MAG: hypothetical protein R3321_11505, partial [Nitrososphaeraceae archaeon]|nr:hypothetical protein [Nitrososphaeraceae archaeon]
MHKSENMAIFSVGVLLVVTIVLGPFFLGSAKADPYFQDPYAKDPYLDERYAPEPYGESQYPDKYSYPPGQVYSPKPDYPPGEIPVMPLAIECPITGLLVYDVDNCPQKPKECTDGYLVFDEANCRIQEEPILTPPVLETPENEVPENEVPENEV